MPEQMTLEQLAEIAGKHWRIVGRYLMWDRRYSVISLWINGQHKVEVLVDGESIGTITPGKEREAIEAINALRGCLE